MLIKWPFAGMEKEEGEESVPYCILLLTSSYYLHSRCVANWELLSLDWWELLLLLLSLR